ncbi:unnamed protein product [Peniophora sp. CBMAI 1063]|nr:unnamed protein product [Peniophora sp. CBMAI 1063]
MSTDEDGRRGGPQPASKRQRRGVACDMCRKRKLKCDGKQAATGKCTNCSDHSWDCTFYTAPGKRVPPGYIEALELKVKRLQNLIARMLPGRDFTHEVGFELTRDNWMVSGVCGAPEPQQPSAFVTTPAAVTPDTGESSALSLMASDHTAPTTPAVDESSSDVEEPDPAIPLRNLRRASRWSSWSQHMSSHLGRSLGVGLFRTAVQMCRELLPDTVNVNAFHMRNKPWETPSWLDGFGHQSPSNPLLFPDRDLMDELIGCYFANSNLLLPALHRPTFEEDMRSGLHRHERTFGSVVLLVCALGSRYSHNPRVLASGDRTWLSAGWKWFTQVRVLDEATLVSPATHLHVLQAMCLGTMYMANVSLTHAWMYIGSGIRLAEDIGAHKRRAYSDKPTLEDELYKRAFWILIYLDRTISAIMGRPCCIQEEDFDLEMPQCCDDEYLTHDDPEQVAKQPSHKPSLLSSFVWTLKLSQIQGLALRTIYASTKAKAHFNFQGEKWLESTVVHFDSLLNSWLDTVPEHLRWDPTSHSNDAFFLQSAYLHSHYHITQMIVHRPFIATLRKRYPFPSLAICTNAARSLTRVVEALHGRNRDQIGGLTWMMQYSGLVILVALGHARLGNIRIDHKGGLRDVDLLISIMREGEVRWRWSGRQADLASALEKRPQLCFRRTLQQRQSHPPSTYSRDLPSYTADSVLGALPQGTGTVLGNIDFDALFGLGDVTSQGSRPWSPSPFDDTFLGVPSMDHLPDGGQGSSSGWQGATFGQEVEHWDWQWTAPPQ